ncbi:YopX family protein [Fusobacterium nucleatum]|nr:YopX family protein [Fusobacterium nucleatum]BEP03211.1 YopX family protein [Fusobacterium nucleatum]
MREIKFKAWDKLNKEMFNVEIMDFQERKVYKDTVSYRKFNDIELMQYTGLKDKNEKEIYEGDVVKLVHTGIEISADRLEDLKRFVGIIKYENGIFKIVKTEKSLIESKYFEMEQKKVSEIFIYSKLYDLEVVGNIYENPELLKENNN